MSALKKTGNGYQLLSSIENAFSPLLTIDRWSPEIEAVARQHDVRRVTIASGWQGSATVRELHALAGQLRSVTVENQTMPLELAVLAELSLLEELSLQCRHATIPFERLRGLRSCVLTTPASLGTVAAAPALERLALFRLRMATLADLAASRTLRSLLLNEVKGIPALQGIEQLALDELRLMFVSGLRSLGRLSELDLHTLEQDGAQKLDDAAAIGDLRELRVLKISGGSAIPSFDPFGNLRELRELGIWNTPLGRTGVSLAPLASLSRLESLKLIGGAKFLRGLREIERLGAITSLEVLFVDKGPLRVTSLEWVRSLVRLREFALHGTTVEDGDIGVLLTLPELRSASVLPARPHYSHSPAELAAAVATREARDY